MTEKQNVKYILIFIGLWALSSVFPADAGSKAEKELLRLIPQTAQLPEWHMTYEPQFFDADNLYEYINGAADLYIMYGFRLVLTADYAVGADSSSVNVEIYHMQSPLHAFGIYAAERSPDEAPADIGVQGYLGANVLNFYKGPYYVKITSFALTKDMRAILRQMGQFIVDNIVGEFREPELFEYFPPHDRVARSERFIPGNFLGQSYFSDGYRCDYYNEKCGTYQLFLVPFKNERLAADAFESYKKYLLERKSPHRIDKYADSQRISVYGDEQLNFAFNYRTFVGGVMGANCPSALKNLMEDLLQNLPNK